MLNDDFNAFKRSHSRRLLHCAYDLLTCLAFIISDAMPRDSFCSFTHPTCSANEALPRVHDGCHVNSARTLAQNVLRSDFRLGIRHIRSVYLDVPDVACI